MATRRVMATLALILGSIAALATPAAATDPTELENVSQIDAGTNSTCGLLDSGTIRCWGYNGYGQLGDGTTTEASVPRGVVGISDATTIGVGGDHACAVVQDGELRCWGRNTWGQLGRGNTTDSTVPVAVDGLDNVDQLALGARHSCAVRSGEVWCWGRNAVGQLGDGTTTDSSVPVQVSGLSGVTDIASLNEHSCAHTNDGKMWCWGSNFHGQLGNGTTADSSVPVQVSGLPTAHSIGVGNGHSCAVDGSELLWCWGYNVSGQLGDGTTTSSSTPVLVDGGNLTAEMVSASAASTCALDTDGAVKCWGSGSSGVLGNGTITGTLTPDTMLNMPDATQLSGAAYRSCALRVGGTVRCTGFNGSGFLGDGTTISRSTPVNVVPGLCEVAPDPGFDDVPSGRYYTTPIAWLAAMGITNGTGPGVFSPHATVKRRDMAVFIHRAFDTPEPSGANPFSDVPDGQYYTDATTWLAEQGISIGTGGGMFSPNAAVPRRDMAVFLHRATGLLDAPDHGFTDIEADSYYEDAVSWLAHSGISNGTGGTLFSPDDDVTRKDMATFLNRRGCGIA